MTAFDMRDINDLPKIMGVLVVLVLMVVGAFGSLKEVMNKNSQLEVEVRTDIITGESVNPYTEVKNMLDQLSVDIDSPNKTAMKNEIKISMKDNMLTNGEFLTLKQHYIEYQENKAKSILVNTVADDSV